MTPYYDHAGVRIYHGDCREVLSGIYPPPCRFDLVLTDPPYGTQDMPSMRPIHGAQRGSLRKVRSTRRAEQSNADGRGVARGVLLSA
jgi:DNA modification methylase